MQITSTNAFYQSVSDNVKTTISTMQTLNKQIASRELYNSLEEIDRDGKLETVLAFHETLSQTEGYIKTNELIKSKMEMKDIEISNMIEVVKELKHNLIINQSAIFADSRLDIIAHHALAQIGRSLNSQYGGSYLFSGSRTSTPPIGDLTDKNQIHNYFGNEEPLYFQTNDYLEIKYNNLNANKKEFHDLSQALHDIIEADNVKDMDRMLELQTVIDDSLTWLIKERTAHTENTNIISTTIETQKKSQDYLQATLANLTQVTEAKFAELSSKFYDMKLSLEAQFKLISVLHTINLASYL